MIPYIRTAILPVGLFLFTSILFNSCSEGPTIPHPASGYYNDDLILAYDPASAEISSMFLPGIRGSDTCNFYFAAKYTHDKINTIGWHPRKKKKGLTFGILEATGPNEFDLYFEKPINKCDTFQFSELPGEQFKLTKKMDWERIWTVKHETNLYSEPDTLSEILVPLRRHDVLKVIDNDLFWVKVNFGNSDEFVGWMEKRWLMRFPG